MMNKNLYSVFMPFKNYFLIAFFLFLASVACGQTQEQPEGKDPFNNPVILSHYTVTDLQQVSVKKLKAINYYYTQSFILDSISCNECRPFDPENFDVSLFEQFRKQSERYTREYTKYGYRLTLLSRDELLYEPVR
jgi:hypothetical protein